MNAKLFTTLALMAIMALLLAAFLPTTNSEDSMTESAELVLGAADFQSGTHQDTTVTQDGLTLAPSAETGHYTSVVLDAPLAFSAVVPQWLAEVPETANMTIRLRTGTANGWWSDWFLIEENDDWMLPEDTDVIGQMIAVPAVDVTHQKIQFDISFSRYEAVSPIILRELRLTFIDASQGPTAEEMVAQQAELDLLKPESTEGGYPKPAVVSRAVWCTDPRCNYSAGLQFVSVTHLIIHHTVSSNSSSDWAAVMRAIWAYHYSRGCPDACWGDIGYNYLVDMNGVIYEGHNGGDDVVGTHAGDANAGTMALSFIGTFTAPDYGLPGIAPPQAMKESAAKLFAWKADQKNIDVYSASRLPNMSWGLPHIMGHRDVYGGTNTECPGDQAHAILPWLRDEVARRIGFVSPHVYVNETSGAFTMSNLGNWWTAPKGCGYNQHAYYTWSTTNPASSTNWGEWRPNLPTSDYYEVEVYAPYCDTGRGETYGARYEITHAGGTATVAANHQENVGLWMSLGTFYFNAGTSGKVRLTDVTTTDSGRGVWFDDIRLRPSSALPNPEVANLAPGSNSWLQQRTVVFDWSTTNAGSVSKTRFQVATDPSFSNLTINKEFDGAPTSYSHSFGQDYRRLYWRVILTLIQGGTVSSSVTNFGIDTEPPSSSITGVYKMEDGYYVLAWAGSDTGSGVTAYNLDYREENGAWNRWLTNYEGTAASFTLPDSQKHYEFRSQAMDGAGHYEAEQPNPDISTRDAIPLKAVIIQPLIFTP